MTVDLSTLKGTENRLSRMQAQQPLIFRTPEGDIDEGYHVTELKAVSVSSVDCGGNLQNWQESVLQLLDGSGGAFMTSEKFLTIVKRSKRAVPALSEGQFFIEFANENKGLRKYSVSEISDVGGRVIVSLQETRALCKPASQYASAAATVSCCGTASTSLGCCA